jgi:hypothetical protein
MKTRILKPVLNLALLLMAASAAGETAWSQGITAFTYQGQLHAGGASSIFDLRFTIWPAAAPPWPGRPPTARWA